MKSKQIRRFVSLFEFLPVADSILAGIYDPFPKKKLKVIPKAELAYAGIVEAVNGSPESFIFKVYDEINSNLYRYVSNRKEYIKDLLMQLVGIEPFLDQDGKYKDNYLPDGSVRWGATNRFLARYAANPEEVAVTVVETYVITCGGLLDLFKRILRQRCELFGIDLAGIENEFYTNLYRYDENVLKQIENGEEPNALKALPAPALPEIKPVKSFSGYINHDQPAGLAEICKKVFNRNNSPKEYAIMFVLLSSRRLILIARGRRKAFFEAWYDFIGKSYNPGTNFYAINKYIVEKAKDGYCFNGVAKDYDDLEIRFEEAFMKLNEARN